MLVISFVDRCANDQRSKGSATMYKDSIVGVSVRKASPLPVKCTDWFRCWLKCNADNSNRGQWSAECTCTDREISRGRNGVPGTQKRSRFVEASVTGAPSPGQFHWSRAPGNSWYNVVRDSYRVYGTPVFVYIMRPFLESSQLCPSTIIVTLNLVKTALLDKNGKMNQRQDRSGTWLCSKIQWHGKNPSTPECFQVLTIYGHSSFVSLHAKPCPRVKCILNGF